MRDIRYQIAIDRQPDAELTGEAAEIEVQQTIEGPTTFRVKFAVDICEGDFNLLDDERLNPGDPDTEVTVTAYLNGESQVLAHGIITERKVSMAEGGAGSSLEIMCTDRRAVMDRVQKNQAHEGKASDVARQILESYGFEADVSDTEISYEENGTTLNQTETDLAFLTKLSGRNDARLWIDWEAGNGLAGFEITETAHFKPSPPRPASNPLGFAPPLLLAPEGLAELKLNSGGGCSNVVSFELHSNAEAPNQSGPIERVDSDSGEVAETEAPEPTTESLGDEPPAPPSQERTRRLVTAGNAQEALVRTQAAINDASWSIQATAETSVQALDAFVAPHQTIKVSGAGQIDSGDYFVKAVTHTVDQTKHSMKLELLRNSKGAT